MASFSESEPLISGDDRRQERLRRLRTRCLPIAAGCILTLVGVVGLALDAGNEPSLADQLDDGNALERYKAGQIDAGKVVLVRPTEDGTAWDLAAQIVDPDGDVRDLAWYQISPQADGQGYPGVQAGEVYVLSTGLTDEVAVFRQGLSVSPAELTQQTS